MSLEPAIRLLERELASIDEQRASLVAAINTLRGGDRAREPVRSAPPVPQQPKPLIQHGRDGKDRPLRGNALLVLRALHRLLQEKADPLWSEIADGAGIPKGSIGAALDELQRGGFIERDAEEMWHVRADPASFLLEMPNGERIT